MKKIFKWIGIVIGTVIVLLVAASVVIMIVVDEEMIAAGMEKALHRHVTLKDIDVGVFAIASGIEVKEVKISNYKTEKQLAALKGKPVAAKDLFVGLQAFNFKIRFLPLLSGKFILNELVLYEPVINVIKYKSGMFNFSDLTAPSTEKSQKKKEVKEVKKPESKSQTLTADNIPIEITIGKVGIEKGQLTYSDQGLGQTFQVYDLTALVHSIDIDPKNLQNRDSIGLDIKMGIKTIGKMKSGSVKSFDIGFDIDGNVIPFDKKTRVLNPEVILKMGLPYGTITGLQIFEKMKSVEQLSKYCGKFSFLKDTITWKNAYVNVWYKNNVVKLKDGKIPTKDYLLTYEGMVNIKSKAVNLDMEMLLEEKHGASVKSGIKKNVEKTNKGKLKKYVKPDKVTEVAMKKLTNEEGRVDLQYKITGTLNKPDPELVKPKLPTITELIKESVGDVKDVAKDKAKDAVKDAVKSGSVDDAKDSLKNKLKF